MLLEEIKLLKQRYFWHGVTQLAAGIFSVIISLLLTFAVERFIGIVFLFSAILSGWNSFQGFREGDKPWQQTFMALIALAAGLVFLFHPLAGVITLDIFLAIYFFVDGIMKVMEFWRVYHLKGSFWILLSGILEVALSMILWSNSINNVSILGITLSAKLIFTSIAFIIVARSCEDV